MAMATPLNANLLEEIQFRWKMLGLLLIGVPWTKCLFSVAGMLCVTQLASSGDSRGRSQFQRSYRSRTAREVRALMELFEHVKALGRAGRPHEGIELVERAAANGDPEGCVILAHWHLYGTYRPRNTGAAYRLLEHAHHKGNTHAAKILANLTANGTGAKPIRRKPSGCCGRSQRLMSRPKRNWRSSSVR